MRSAAITLTDKCCILRQQEMGTAVTLICDFFFSAALNGKNKRMLMVIYVLPLGSFDDMNCLKKVCLPDDKVDSVTV